MPVPERKWKVPVIVTSQETGYVIVDAPDLDTAIERAEDSSLSDVQDRSFFSWDIVQDGDHEPERVQNEELPDT